MFTTEDGLSTRDVGIVVMKTIIDRLTEAIEDEGIKERLTSMNGHDALNMMREYFCHCAVMAMEKAEKEENNVGE